MRPKVLKNKPLIEAILELKWFPLLPTDANGVDTDLRLFLGRFHDAIGKEYPALEVLPAAAMPEQMTPNFPQYRFRKTQGAWPLVQLGSGIVTLNDTAGYSWDEYHKRAVDLIHFLFKAYPSKMRPTSLELRYINAVFADFDKENIFGYLENKFRVHLALPERLFESGAVKTSPNLLSMQTAFPTVSPVGSLRFGINRGKANDRDALVWETVLQSLEKQLPEMPRGFSDWLNTAHGVIEDWFFKLVEGDLLKQFS